MVIEPPRAPHPSHPSISGELGPLDTPRQEFVKYFAFSEMERRWPWRWRPGRPETGAEEVLTAEEQMTADTEMEDGRMTPSLTPVQPCRRKVVWGPGVKPVTWEKMMTKEPRLKVMTMTIET